METLGQRIFRIIVSNIGALVVFYMMLLYGRENVPLVEQYWKIPFSLLTTYLLYQDFMILIGKD
ncbi:hypothetical protein [Alkaliphilus sp. B6464]|uniref:hypothetical protein n=1 Tax=Alkaliphilus sp. B6464 TaxID=2731219 RepID=UPI001BAC88E5|nr:hypothetical protein [Alkaliphilus sp. B6464]QUH21967.1 hypothetical protein HYG84_18860 [Alkaliphilus sp. B6464]